MINSEFRSLDSIEESNNKIFTVCDSLLAYDAKKTIITSRFEFIDKKDKIKSNILQRIVFLLQRLFNKIGCTKKLDVSREFKDLFAHSGDQMVQIAIEDLEAIKNVMETLKDKFTRNMGKNHNDISANFAVPLKVLREAIESKRRNIEETQSTIDEQETDEEDLAPKPSSQLVAQLRYLIDNPFEHEESD